MQALSQAIGIIGSQQKLAQRCGVVQTAVAAWLKRQSVPAEHCASIELATKGIVTRRELRPNDWQKIWPELANQTKA
jgi:DNA-binding transcriptional regulator YdaS (Cro superfamily)